MNTTELIKQADNNLDYLADETPSFGWMSVALQLATLKETIKLRRELRSLAIDKQESGGVS